MLDGPRLLPAGGRDGAGGDQGQGEAGGPQPQGGGRGGREVGIGPHPRPGWLSSAPPLVSATVFVRISLILSNCIVFLLFLVNLYCNESI